MLKRTSNLMISVTALSLGGMIYIFFREKTIIATFFADWHGINGIQRLFSKYKADFIRYYFVDFLWGFSLSTGIIALNDPSRKGLLFCAFLAFICGSLWEVLQHFRVVTGTADLWDVFMYLLASIISVAINLLRRENYEKN